MSQRRANKRKRETEPAHPYDQREVEKEIISKRVRLDNKTSLADGRSKGTIRNSERHDDKGSAEMSAVRRSGRTPKAKARDYDDITHVSPDLSKDFASSSIQTLSAPTLESSHGTSLTVPVAYISSTKSTPESSDPKDSSAFKVGHKRETRKSYQKYLEELEFGNDLPSGTKKRSRHSSLERGQENSNKGSKEGNAKKNDRTKSYSTTTAIQPNTKTPTQSTPKTPIVTESNSKTPTQSSSKTPTHSSRKSSNEQRVEILSPAAPRATSVSEQSDVEGDLGDFSPKVRASKRTPVPKRKFSLLEDLPEDLKKAKKMEQGEYKIQMLEKERHSEGERNFPSETQLENHKSKKRLSVEKTTKSSVSGTSTLPSVKGQTPKQREKEKKQDSTPQSKRSSGKVKNVKSSDSQFLIESQTLCLSSDASVAVTMARTPETPKSQPGIEQVASQSKRSDRKRRKRAPVSSVTASSVSSNAASPLVDKPSLEATSHKREGTGPTHATAVPISEIVSAVASKYKTPEIVVKSKQKLSQKSSEKKKKSKETSQSLASNLSSPLGDGDRVKLNSPTVCMIVSPGPASSSKQEISLPGSTVPGDSDLTKKKKKVKKDHSSEKTPKASETTSESELSSHFHHHHHHHHKHHKHSKTKKLTETATAEVREEAGEHIILKLHLHKDESPKKLDAKKQKSKISIASSSGEAKKHVHSKVKKGKSSESKSKLINSSNSGVTESKKKLSIKFKGLSQNQIGLEIPTDSIQPSERETVTERTELSAAKHKHKKDEKKKKKSSDSGNKTRGTDKKDQEEKKPVKLVIKKDKTLLAGQEESPPGIKLQAQKTKKIVKKSDGENSAVKKEGTGNHKKKGKSPSPKKALSAYLLFCKKHRHKVLEEFPGIEFSQISKKVGEAWNNLPEEEKQYWKDKAAELKRQLLGSDTATPKKPASKQQSKSDKKGKSHAKSSHSKGESLPATPTTQPIDMAAHLKLLGESLMTVGLLLKQQDQMEVHGSLSVLLDSALCAISPLLFLTSQIPEIDGVSKDTQVQILDNLAYIMPGL